MLKNLLKYDLKYVYKHLIYIYILTIVCALLTNLFGIFADNSFILVAIGITFKIMTFVLIITSFIYSIIRLWSRFKNNLYGDESYLIHTLPVTKKDIYLSKILTAVIVTLTSIIVLAVSLFIIVDHNTFFATIQSFNLCTNEIDCTSMATCSCEYSDVISQFLTITLILFLEVIFIILTGYFAIIMGHKVNKNRMTNSIIWGIAIYFLCQACNILFLFLVGLFNKEVFNMFFNATATNSAIRAIMILVILIYVSYNISYYIIGKKELEKGIDVD